MAQDEKFRAVGLVEDEVHDVPGAGVETDIDVRMPGGRGKHQIAQTLLHVVLEA